MNFPLISEYVEAIKAAEDNFEQLKHPMDFQAILKMYEEASRKIRY